MSTETGSKLIMTVLAVQDVEKCARFYKTAFEWPVEIEMPEVVMFRLDGRHNLMLYKRESFGINTGKLPVLLPEEDISGTELYFHTVDIQGAIARLQEAGARELSPLSQRPWGDEAAYFADPEGNVLAIAQPTVS